MTAQAIQALLVAEMQVLVDDALADSLALYLELLMRWNGRTNLSAIREPSQIVLRHFGESLQCARALPAGVRTLLDYGSGAGFPGVLCALARPELAVVLAESQGKKAAFLQEVCRVLSIGASVQAGRVEKMPVEQRFDVVTLRAVDRMQEACLAARSRVMPGGWIAVMTARSSLQTLAPVLNGVAWRPPVPIEGTEQGVIALGRVLVV